MKFGNEIRVGLVFLAGIGVITIGYFQLRGVGLNGDVYYLQLHGAATIAQGNDVRLQGVKIGQVVEVDFDAESQQPLLKLAIKHHSPPFALLKTYAYSVSNTGIVGESYVDIRGKFNPKAAAFEPNNPKERIPGRAGGGLSGITDNANDVIADFRVTMTKLNTTLDRINKGVLNYDNQIKLARTMDGVAKLTNNASRAFGPQGVRFGFGDPAAQANLNRTMMYAANASRQAEIAASNIAFASKDARGLTTDLRRDLTGVTRSIVDENRGKIAGLLDGLEDASHNIAGITETLDFTLKQGDFAKNAGGAFASLKQAADNVQAATLGLRKLSEDQATQQDLKGTLTALRQTTEALRDTTQAIKGMATDENTTGQLKGALTSLSTTSKNLAEVTTGIKNIIADPQVQSDLKSVASNLNGTLAATRASAERVNSLLGGRRGRTAPGSASATPAAPGSTATEPAAQHMGYSPGGIDFTYRYLFNREGDQPDGTDISGTHFGDITFNGEFFGGPARAGISNIGDGTDFTLQTGRFIGNNNALRYGLYRSKLGVGADLHRGKFSLEGNAWNPNGGSYNLYGGYQLTPNLQVMAGWESIRGTRANAIGVRITP